MTTWKNKLYFGDNLDILRENIRDESVDMIYLDPPFNSKATYNVLFEEKDGKQSDAQITAFEDTWHWGSESEAAYMELVQYSPIQRLSDLISAFKAFLGRNDMMAYLVMMAIRLVELWRVLKPTGSIYLHCDPTASHYLKLLMDSIFGIDKFKAEIIWKRTSAHSDSKSLGSSHDSILFFTKGKTFLWNKIYQPYSPEYIESHYRRVDSNKRKFRTDNLTAMGLSGGGYVYEWNGVTKTWRCPMSRMQELHDAGRIHYTKSGTAEYIRFLDEMPGTPLQDLWDDIPPINSQAAERLGYPTQKPEALLERIVQASSNEGDLILDPFCGCGTTITVAERLKRSWVGIDITHLAVTLMKNRLDTTFDEQELAPYEVLGVPVDVGSARLLARDKPFEFEYWALGLVDARPARDRKKGGDSGVDGVIYFFDDVDFTSPKKIIVQVKGGEHIGPNYVRDLNGTVEREKAAIGILITMKSPTKPMKTEAVSAGYYTSKYFNRSVPRIQILTIEELLAGKSPEYYRVPTTFKSAPRKYKNDAFQPNLIDN